LEKEQEPEWILTAPMSASPFGRVLVLEHKLRLAFVTAKPGEKAKGYAIRVCDLATGLGREEEHDEVTAVLCLPVTDSRGGRARPLWHVAVVGYASGHVDVISDGGETLARRKLHEGPVRRIRSSPVSFRPSSQLVPAVADVLVVYDAVVCTLTGGPLFTTLVDHRGRAAEARARGEQGLTDVDASTVTSKRFRIPDQVATDACVVRCPNK